MKKINTSPISGTLELTPTFQAEFNRLKAEITTAFHLHGFQSIETPTIDRTEILLAKAGGDTEKQIYKVVKTAETSDEADQALRFDHTVPLARYAVEHMNDLTFPFKVTQIGRNFRGERPQKGRFREFYQCDVDVIGWNTLPIAYDAEVVATLADAIKVLPLPRFTVRISNRKLLSGLLESMNLEHFTTEILGIVDHAEKVPPEVTVAALEKLNIGSENVVKITTFIGINGSAETVIKALRNLGCQNEVFQEGVAELESVLQILAEISPEVEAIADMLIVRGLDYYTGTVFETIAPDYREIGSICSGGRYENLASHYTDQALPGVGGSIGLSRLFFIFQHYNLITENDNKPVDVCMIPITRQEFQAAARFANALRANGQTVDIVMSEKKLGDKLKYASRVANYAAIIGETEAAAGRYHLRNLATGEETEIVA